MKIGVVSDTHGHRGSTTAAVGLLRTTEQRIGESLSAVIHCGDVGLPHVIVPLFRHWPTHFVAGNNDWDRATLAAVIAEHGLFWHDSFGELTLGDTRIAWLHGDDLPLLRETIAGGEYALVCHGHTHRSEKSIVDGTTVLNPGALFRAREYTIAIVDLPAVSVEMLTIDRTHLG